MRIVYMGSGEFGLAGLEALHPAGHEILEIYTQPAKPAGRGKSLQKTPVGLWAEKNGIPLVETDNVNDPSIVERIKQKNPQVILVIAFGQKIGRDLLHLPHCHVINLHASLLPRYRGAAPINWAIIHGEKQTGLTIFELNDAWDAGRILGQISTDIQPAETAGELHDRLACLAPQLVIPVLRQIADGTVTASAQDQSLACRAPRLKKTDAALDWNQPAQTLCHFIHGMWPWPGAYCYLQQKTKNSRERITLARVQVTARPAGAAENLPPLPPGTITVELNVICGDGNTLALQELKPDNGKLMRFTDFVNGRRLEPGDRFLNG